MSAILETPPPARAYTRNPIWVGIETDATISARATVVITISSTGPTAGQTFRIQWGGNDLTFTVTDPLTASSLLWPLHDGSESLTTYADRVAERLAGNETLHDYFEVDRSGTGVITLRQRVLEVVDITVTENMTNVSAVVTDVTTVTPDDNLRALVEVWEDTGDLATDTRLASLHSPYRLPAGDTDIDISAAFAVLKPHPPTDTTIQIGLSLTLPKGVATDAFRSYYLRYADKYGTPAVAEVLQRSADSYLAVLGSYAGDYLQSISGGNTEPYIRHNYRRRAAAWDHYTETTSKLLRRPIADTQPDWVYVLLYPDAVGETAITGDEVDCYVECLLYWSDGTTSVHQPYDTDASTLVVGQMYWIISGYRQLKINGVAPSGGTDADAYVVAYDWLLKRVSDDAALTAVYYEVQIFAGWDYFLLFSNGQGGCETACFRGKAAEKYRTTAEKYRTPRDKDWEVQTHEYNTYLPEGQREWELNTGWTADADWLEHLRQLALADAVWLVDVANERFLAVTVETRDLETRRDDETLYNLPITVRAAWVDTDANV